MYFFVMLYGYLLINSAVLNRLKLLRPGRIWPKFAVKGFQDPKKEDFQKVFVHSAGFSRVI